MHIKRGNKNQDYTLGNSGTGGVKKKNWNQSEHEEEGLRKKKRKGESGTSLKGRKGELKKMSL